MSWLPRWYLTPFCLSQPVKQNLSSYHRTKGELPIGGSDGEISLLNLWSSTFVSLLLTETVRGVASPESNLLQTSKNNPEKKRGDGVPRGLPQFTRIMYHIWTTHPPWSLGQADICETRFASNGLRTQLLGSACSFGMSLTTGQSYYRCIDERLSTCRSFPELWRVHFGTDLFWKCKPHRSQSR